MSLALLLAFGLVPPTLQPNSTVKEAIADRYRQRVQIMRKRDLPAYSNTMTSNFTFKTYRGSIQKGKNPYLSLIQMSMENLTDLGRRTYKIISITVKPNHVTVTVDERDLDTQTKNGQKHTTAVHEVYQEQWVPTPAGWKTSGVEELSGSFTRDGRVITSHTTLHGKWTHTFFQFSQRRYETTSGRVAK